MNFKKGFLVGILMLTILTISAVSASDIENSDNLTVLDEQVSSDIEELAVDGEDENLVSEYDVLEDDYEIGFSRSVDVNSEYNRLLFYEFKEDVGGSVAVHINGTEVYNNTPSTDYTPICVSDLNHKFDYGIYDVDFIYSGDDSHDGFIKSVKIDFTYNFEVSFPSGPYRYGDGIDFHVYVPTSGGTVEYVVNGKKHVVEVTDEDGITVNIEDLKLGENNISFSFIDDNYPVKTENHIIKVVGLIKVSPYRIAYDESLYVTLELPSDAKGNLNVYDVRFHWDIDSGDLFSEYTLIKTVKVENGIVNESVSGLSLGKHYIYANYTGNDYETDLAWQNPYIDDESGVWVSVVGPKVVFPSTMSYNEVYDCEFILPNSSYNGELYVEFGDEGKTYDVINGKGKFIINASQVNREFYLSYDDENGYHFSGYFDVEIKEVKTPSGNESGNTTPSGNGSGNESGNTTPSGNETPAVVVDPKVVASNANVVYSAGSYYTIKVYGTDGKLANGAKVVIKVNGKTFKTLTTVEGVVKFKVTQVPGTYKVQATALGKSVTKTLTVKHIVTLKSVTVKKSAKKLVIQASLAKVSGKYLKNKKITFKFNGKKYTAKTNAKGVAKVTIKSSVLKKLKVGKKVTYQATYSKDTVKKTVKIKK